MTSYPEGPPFPEHQHRGLWGAVEGTVRSSSGQPLPDCGIAAYATTTPIHPVPSRAGRSNAHGRYRLGLPAATYRIAAYGQAASGVPLHGEATGVVLAVGHTVIVDIVVTERTDLAGESQP